MILSAVSTVAALGAVFFAWLTVNEARAGRAEDAYYRELERLHGLLKLVGDVGAAGKNAEWTHGLAIAQLHLDAVLSGYPGLTECRELVNAEVEGVFDAYIEARDEVARLIEQHVAARPARP